MTNENENKRPDSTRVWTRIGWAQGGVNSVLPLLDTALDDAIRNEDVRARTLLTVAKERLEDAVRTLKTANADLGLCPADAQIDNYEPPAAKRA